MSPPLIKHKAIVTFDQELGRLPLNGRYTVCTTVEESQLLCDFLANNPRHPGGKPLLTSSTKSTKRTKDEKSSAKSSKSPPKKLKVGADLNPTQARSSRVVEENRSFVEIAFETPNIFKLKRPPPDCHFSAFNYFRRQPSTSSINRRRQ
uniref:Uncharacterized protein n=1 Tax=Romanomermis culicivorax TaxID=13658 RepID=A0A915IPA0_ROMCU